MAKTDESHQKLLVSVTLDEFIQALRDSMFSDTLQNDITDTSRKFLYGLKELSNFLGCSLSTAARIHKSGVIHAATYRTGRILMFDQEMILELLHVTKRKFKGLRSGYRS